MTSQRIATSVWTIAAIVILTATTSAQDDPAKLIVRKDVKDRLNAIAIISSRGHEKAEALLQKAAKDRDWQVVESAVEALAVRGSDDSTKQLLSLAVGHPLRRVRLAAARTLRVLDPDEAAERLIKKLRGEGLLRVAESLAEVGGEQSEKEFVKLLASSDAAVRRAAVTGLETLAGESAVAQLHGLVQDRDLSVRAAAVEALAEMGDSDSVPLLLAALSETRVEDVIERRLIQAVGRLLSRLEGDAQAAALEACYAAWTEDVSAAACARLARLLGRLCEGEPALPGREDRVSLLQARGLSHENESVRAAAVDALARAAASGVWEALVERLESDESERVRFQGLRALARIDEAGAVAPLVRALAGDAAASVREEAAVLLGRAGDVAALPALRAALADVEWPVMLAAAIAVGRLQDRDSVAPLVAFLEHDDWKLRASAVVGLGRIGVKDVVEPLIDALDDRDPVVASTAHEYLQSVTRTAMGPRAQNWKKWWDKNSEWFKDPEATVRKRDSRYADTTFRRRPYASLQDSDVIVLTSGRDQLEKVLDKLEIEYRLTPAGKVHESELHPNAVFLANCQGKIEDSDVERLDWFVRSGGYLLASCWGLTNTVVRTFPGVVRAMPQGQQPAGVIPATPVADGSIFLEDVFAEAVDTHFQLQGYQIAHVLDPERYEVLIDSPAGAARWGAGNLAGWFSVGHGVVLNSTNHFALAGMTGAKFSSEDQRKAFAIDRLGYSYEQVRDLARRGHFKSDSKAVDACDDLTILRLVARFVHVQHNDLKD